METEIRIVNTKKDFKTFVQLFYDLYRDCPQAVPYLYSDEVNTLSKDKNPAFEFCEAEYFLAYQGDKVVTGGLGNFNATDIPVGEVVSVTHSTDYLTREVMVKMHADPMNLKVVELVGNPS